MNCCGRICSLTDECRLFDMLILNKQVASGFDIVVLNQLNKFTVFSQSSYLINTVIFHHFLYTVESLGGCKTHGVF